MAEQQSRERDLARAAEELHGATTELLQLREMLEQTLITTVRMYGGSTSSEPVRLSEEGERNAEYRAGLREQPVPRLPLLPPGKDPTLARRVEEELHGFS